MNIPITDIRVVSDQPVLPQNMTIDEWVYVTEEMHGELVHDIDIQTDLGLEGHWKIKHRLKQLIVLEILSWIGLYLVA